MTYSLVARRYDKAFFMAAEVGSELERLFDYPDKESVVIFREFEKDHLWYEKGLNPKDFERWIVANSLPLVVEYQEKH